MLPISNILAVVDVAMYITQKGSEGLVIYNFWYVWIKKCVFMRKNLYNFTKSIKVDLREYPVIKSRPRTYTLPTLSVMTRKENGGKSNTLSLTLNSST